MLSRTFKKIAICTIVLLALGAVTTTAFAAGSFIPHTRTFAWEIAPTVTGLIYAPQSYSIGISANVGDKWQMTFSITGGTFNAAFPFGDTSVGSDPATPNCIVKPVNAPPPVDYQVALRSQTSTSVTFDVTAVGQNPANNQGVAIPCVFRLNDNKASHFNFNSTAVGQKVLMSVVLLDEFNLQQVDAAGPVDMALVGEAATMTFNAYQTTIDAINFDNFPITGNGTLPPFSLTLPLSRFVQGANPPFACAAGSVSLINTSGATAIANLGGGLAANYPNPGSLLQNGLGFVPSASGASDCPLVARALVTTGSSFPNVKGVDGTGADYVLAGAPSPDLVTFTLTSAITANWDDVRSICFDLNNNGVCDVGGGTAANELFTQAPGNPTASLTVNGNRLGPGFKPSNIQITAGKNFATNADTEIQGRTIILDATVQRAIDGVVNPRHVGPNALVEFDAITTPAGPANPVPFWTFMYNGTKLISNMAVFNGDLTGATGISFKLRFTNLSGIPVKIIVMPSSVVADPAANVAPGAIVINPLPGNTQTGGYTVPANSSIHVPFNTNIVAGDGQTAPPLASGPAGVRTTVTVIAATTLNNILGEVLMPNLAPTLNTLSEYSMKATDGVNTTLFYRFN